MTNNSSKSLDILGVKPIADSVDRVTKGVVDGAAAFLGRICLPAAEEFGLLLRDKVARYRAINAANIALNAEKIVGSKGDNPDVHAHPRIVGSIVESGSWTDAEDVQKVWASLLASACTPDGRDETNLIFVDLLARLTTSEVRVLNHCCEIATKRVTDAGWVAADMLIVEAEELSRVAGHADFHRLDLELDHLRSLDLIHEGFNPHSTSANVSPTAIALHLYARGHGFAGSLIEFFELAVRSSGPEGSA